MQICSKNTDLDCPKFDEIQYLRVSRWNPQANILRKMNYLIKTWKGSISTGKGPVIAVAVVCVVVAVAVTVVGLC